MKFKKILGPEFWRDSFLLTLISLFFLFINTYKLDSWYYSALGDEYAFFNSAKAISLGNTKLSLLPKVGQISILDQRGVYGVVPVATSAYQALIMKILGKTHWGWLMSSILVVIFSFWPLYFGIKDWFGKKTALFSLIIFASSHYLWAFSHTGYWNILAIFPGVLTFFLFTKALKQKGLFWWFLSGLSSALSFYIHYYPGISFPLIILYLIINHKKIKLRQVVLFFAGFLSLFTPYLMINYKVALEVISNRTLVVSSEISQGKRNYYFFKNLLGSFLAFYKSSGISHYVSGSLIDPVSSILFSFGLAVMFTFWRKYYFFIIILGALLVMLGGFSQYTYIPISRLYFMLPIVALIAGLGLQKIFILLRMRFSQSSCFLIITIVFLIILTLNIYRFFFQTPRVSESIREAVAIKALKEFCLNRKTAIIDEAVAPVLKPAISSYDFENPPSLFNIDKININDILPYNCVILVRPSMPQLNSFSKEIENYFPSFKKSVVKDFSGKITASVYYMNKSF